MKKDKSAVLWSDRKHWMWFPFSFTKYELTEDRLYEEKGLLNTHYDETLLYRAIDICLERTLAQKLFGTGTIILTLRADSQPQMHLVNIKHPKEVKQMLSHAIEDARNKNHTVGKEFYSNGPLPPHGSMPDDFPDTPDDEDGYDFSNDHDD